ILAYYADALLLLVLPRRFWLWALGGVCGAFAVTAVALDYAGGGSLLAETAAILIVGGLQAAFFGQIQNAVRWRLARADLARLAVAEERLRIARDLHDVLGQRLSAMALKSELAARLVGTDPARAEAEMTEVGEVARGALDEMRATVSGYRGTSLAGETRTAAALLGASGVATTVSAVP